MTLIPVTHFSRRLGVNMLINQFIHKLEQRAAYYTALLKCEGLPADYDDVCSEFGLAFVELAGRFTQDRGASFSTYMEGCFKSRFKAYRRKLIQSRIPVEADAPQKSVDPDNGVRFLIAEIDERLSEQDKAVFSYMINGGKRPQIGGFYNSVSRVRRTAKQVIGG